MPNYSCQLEDGGKTTSVQFASLNHDEQHTDYDRRYYQDINKILVTVHTPTALIREDNPEVYQKSGHIARGCKKFCVYGKETFSNKNQICNILLSNF